MPSRTPLIFFILILLCFSLYANSLNNAFVSDDIGAIVDNPYISQPLHYWLEPGNLLSSLGYSIQGYNPFIQHLINIILHCINTILVFFFLRLFFKPVASLLGACIFAAHPIHTEAVTWVSGRSYLIITLFILITYLLYRSSTNPKNNKRHRIFSYVLSLVVFSYFTIKNIGIFSLTPFLLILSDITFNRWRKNWKLWIPFLGIAILNLFLSRNAILERITYTAAQTGEPVTWFNPIFDLAYSFFTHLGLLLWPAKLTPYHEPVTITSLGLNIEVFSLFLLLAISIFFLFRRSKELFFALGIFVLFLAPTYSPVQVSYIVAERYLYFPSVALSIAIAFVYENYVIRKQGRFNKYLLAILASLIFAYGIRTVVRNQDWKAPVIFWKKAVEVSPQSGRAHNGLAGIYFNKGDIKSAIKHYNKAIEIKPNFADAYNNRGLVYQAEGNLDQAFLDYNKAIEFKPDFAKAYNNRGSVHKAKGNFDQALLDYSKAIEIKPNLAEAYNNRGNAHKTKGKLDQALLDYNKAIEIEPNLAEVYYNRGSAHKIKGNFDQAFLDYSKAIEIEPNFAKAYINRGNVHKTKGNLDQAFLDYSKAIEIKPNLADAYSNRGLAYQTKGNFDQALLDYNKAIEIKPNYAQAYCNRAVMYFEKQEYIKSWEDVHKAESLGYKVNPEFLKLLEPYRD
ncbi:tetratricopeptide repeat protein [Candidatus Omnitrophota bacterium]